MTHPPVVRGIFSLGLSVAVLKGVQKTVRKHLEKQGWIEPQEVDYELIFTIDRLKNLIDDKHNPLTAVQQDISELSWRKVLNFISRQFSELDTRIYVLILLLSLLVPIVWSVLDGDHEGALEDNDNDINVDIIENERRLKHYNDGERAVLQFGKNRSEPIILSYKNMNVLEGEHEFTNKKDHDASHLTSKSENALDKAESKDVFDDHPEQQPKVDIKCDKNDLSEEENGEDSDNKEEDHSSSLELESQSESKVESTAEPDVLSRDTRTTSSLKSSTSFPVSFKGSIDLRSLNPPSSLLHLQVSPTKSTNLDAQVNTEQAYSQPFRY
ncbi:hypothetical protein SMKI_08G2370 [Saccharomyces mikatae IFO 1815]|uniref:Nvj1p n=1 Tax=Saccharomyces mikatae IFO 1815 TaxID=226126 RepID=A0AA35IZ43_SACMI|nr:uncharacterized protein SMKI_08G2370 [Saccharomyces mikatae IFO 1815]CAI4039568.1 hypothetical protein SMKI_08G2370 [Saccharomyces mikatae IFO 1815]